ncbi:MAG: carboxypeptidase regulatory-like domain-containing protein [Actinobacteria bacterium]|nr:carboxypeptidase regulatory-like domain-containing protein [Actinomycetota bacterium]
MMGTSIAVLTDSLGQFRLSGIRVGTYRVVRAFGNPTRSVHADARWFRVSRRLWCLR